MAVKSIYKSPEGKRAILKLHDEQMARIGTLTAEQEREIMEFLKG